MVSTTEQGTHRAWLSPHESLNMVRNSIRTAICTIAYLRNLFDEETFEDRLIHDLPVKILRPFSNPDARMLLSWIDYGVFDALEKEYLRLLLFSIHDMDDNLIECYHFGFSYNRSKTNLRISSATAEGTCQTIRTNVNTGKAWRLKSVAREQTLSLLRNLILITQDLSPLPECRYLSMKIWYYDDKVPSDYEPQHFRSPLPIESRLKFCDIPLNVELGNVRTVFHGLELKLKTGLEARRLIQDPIFKNAEKHPLAVTAARIGRAQLPDSQPQSNIVTPSNTPTVQQPATIPVPKERGIPHVHTSSCGGLPASIATHQVKLQDMNIHPVSRNSDSSKLLPLDSTINAGEGDFDIKRKATEFIGQKNVIKLIDFRKFVAVNDTRAQQLLDELIAAGVLAKYSTKVRGYRVLRNAS